MSQEQSPTSPEDDPTDRAEIAALIRREIAAAWRGKRSAVDELLADRRAAAAAAAAAAEEDTETNAGR